MYFYKYFISYIAPKSFSLCKVLYEICCFYFSVYNKNIYKTRLKS